MKDSFSHRQGPTPFELEFAQAKRGVANFYKKWFGMGSTYRTMDMYRQDLFPTLESNEQLKDYLHGKCVVDIGSGLTHLVEDSLINVMAADGDESTLVMGIDPHASGVQGNKLLELFARLLERSLKRKHPDDLPGAKYAVRGEMQDVNLPEKAVDIFISNSALGLWICDPEQLLEIFKVMKYALKDDGEIRIGGRTSKVPIAHFIQENELGDYIRKHFTITRNDDIGLIIFKKSNSN
jgi:hypothetical protein